MLASKAEENCKVLCSQQGIELSWSLKYIKLFKLGRLVKNHKSARKQGRKLSCAAHALSFICDQAQRELAFGKLQSVCRWWGRLNTREAPGWWSNASMTGNMQFLRWQNQTTLLLHQTMYFPFLTSDVFSLIPQEAQCVVGTVSIHPLKALPIGSPNRKRWLGED